MNYNYYFNNFLKNSKRQYSIYNQSLHKKFKNKKINNQLFETPLIECIDRLNKEIIKPISNILYCGEHPKMFLDEAYRYGLLDFLEFIVICSENENDLNATVEHCHAHQHIMDSFNRMQFIKKDCNLIPFQEETFDCIISNCELHWHPDVPSTLAQYHRVLNPDGLLLGAVLGGETLRELQLSFQLAEEDLQGGQSVRVSPLMLGSDVNNQLQKAGQISPNVDVHTDILHFDHAHGLLQFIQDHGESNAIKNKSALSLELLVAMEEIQRNLFSSENVISKDHILDSSMIEFKAGVFSTFQYLQFIGWKKALDEKQIPRERGSVTKSFESLKEEIADANKDDETFDPQRDLKFGRLTHQIDPRRNNKKDEGLILVDQFKDNDNSNKN